VVVLARKFRKTLGKSKKKGDLFKPPKHKDLAQIVTFKSIKGAEEACKKLENLFKHARSKDRKLTILRATQYAANRERAGAKNPKFSPKTKKKWQEIAEIYEEASDWMQEHYP